MEYKDWYYFFLMLCFLGYIITREIDKVSGRLEDKLESEMDNLAQKLDDLRNKIEDVEVEFVDTSLTEQEKEKLVS